MRLLAAFLMTLYSVASLASPAKRSGVFVKDPLVPQTRLAQAETKKVKPKKKLPPKKIVKKPVTKVPAPTASSSSSVFRANKKMLLLVRASPFYYANLPGGSLDGYYILNPSLIVGAYVSYATASVLKDVESDPQVTLTRFDASEMQVMAGGRYFFLHTNSFWLNGFNAGSALGYRTLTLDIEGHATVEPSIAAELHVEGTAFPVDIMLGSLWCFDSGICAGVDLITRTFPLAPAYELTITEYGPVSSAEAIAELEKEIDTLNRDSYGGLLVLSVGYAF
jgi:hypothetical protein